MFLAIWGGFLNVSVRDGVSTFASKSFSELDKSSYLHSDHPELLLFLPPGQLKLMFPDSVFYLFYPKYSQVEPSYTGHDLTLILSSFLSSSLQFQTSCGWFRLWAPQTSSAYQMELNCVSACLLFYVGE